ncbi:MAG TPA: PDZ domain-containing protein, partial [Saprospiraceae bacterium]|nr:PDZ domain-containing protein [Saprospiraceae bacterium]
DYMFSGKGMRIDGVREGKTADSAGLKKGDVVMKMGDIEVVDMMSYMKALSAFEKGQETEVEVLREGKKIKTTVVFQ